ncbi:hypothetical protein AQUCO_14200001v1 [Aquilegia coerulea]|uniref:14-3-3 domain-containing protein n=1 Tax=Aquilegia coerulea TaxID=218851 RepID=A0A2G5C0X3_AQUCA|nr:hypothetical protein AQUCO_14200001v1 [Aquilegia coerulea]
MDCWATIHNVELSVDHEIIDTRPIVVCGVALALAQDKWVGFEMERKEESRLIRERKVNNSKMMASQFLREECVYLAKLSKVLFRYGDMREFMEGVAKMGVKELTNDERYLLCFAYKKIIRVKINTWKVICSIEQKEKNLAKVERAKIISKYKNKIGFDISMICLAILELLESENSYLIEQTLPKESYKFYLENLAEHIDMTMGNRIENELTKICDVILNILESHLVSHNTLLGVSAESFAYLYTDYFILKEKIDYKIVSKLSLEDNVYLASVAEEAEQYDDVVEVMRNIVEKVGVEKLTLEQRYILHLAYEKLLLSIGASWRLLIMFTIRGNSTVITEKYWNMIRSELDKMYDELEKLMQPKAPEMQQHTFEKSPCKYYFEIQSVLNT